MPNTKSASRKKYCRRGNGFLLTKEELARKLGEEPRTIDIWRKRGILPVIDAGYRSKRYLLDACLAALERRTIRAVRTA